MGHGLYTTLLIYRFPMTCGLYDGLENYRFSVGHGEFISHGTWIIVTIVTPTGVRMCREGRDEKPSPAGRLTACLMHVGRTSDWHGCETRGGTKSESSSKGWG